MNLTNQEIETNFEHHDHWQYYKFFLQDYDLYKKKKNNLNILMAKNNNMFPIKLQTDFKNYDMEKNILSMTFFACMCIESLINKYILKFLYFNPNKILNKKIDKKIFKKSNNENWSKPVLKLWAFSRLSNWGDVDKAILIDIDKLYSFRNSFTHTKRCKIDNANINPEIKNRIYVTKNIKEILSKIGDLYMKNGIKTGLEN